MTTKNAILLAVMQEGGVAYAALLNQIAEDYANTNSARAALSRALRDLAAVGLIRRSGQRILLTQRGARKVATDMKNKLLLKLNALMGSGRQREPDIGTLVELLSILLEHSKKDAGLRRVARQGLAFDLDTLRRYHRAFEARLRHQQYLAGVLARQLATLEKMGFRDRVRVPWDARFRRVLENVHRKSKKTIFYVACPEGGLLEEAAARLGGTRRREHTFFPKKAFPAFLALVEQNRARAKGLELFLDGLRVSFEKEHAVVRGAYTDLRPFRGLGDG